MSKSTTQKSGSQEKTDVFAEKPTTPKPAIKKPAKVAPSKKILGRSGRGGT